MGSVSPVTLRLVQCSVSGLQHNLCTLTVIWKGRNACGERQGAKRLAPEIDVKHPNTFAQLLGPLPGGLQRCSR